MRKRTSLLVAVAVVWACGGDDGTGLTGRSTSRVSLGFVSAGATSGATDVALLGNVAQEDVGEINVQLDYVEVLGQGGGWVRVDPPSGPVALNLLDLPGEADPPLVLARGDLEAGEYTKARIFFSSLELVLDEEVCLGKDCFPAGTYSNVVVPSSAQSGIKTDAHFTIEEGSAETEVTLVFVPDATVKNITFAPGRDVFIVAPVFRGPAAEDGDGS